MTISLPSYYHHFTFLYRVKKSTLKYPHLFYNALGAFGIIKVLFKFYTLREEV